jgi:hypothetical protein
MRESSGTLEVSSDELMPFFFPELSVEGLGELGIFHSIKGN